MGFTRRKWMFGIAGITSGCATRSRSRPAADSITILYPYDDTVLGPNMDMPAQFMMFLPLTARNATGELEGRLAEHWEHSPDYRKWTIRLRSGVRWHDGVPVTAHDIKFNLELRSHPDLMWFPPNSFNVKVIDELTYTITYLRDGLSGSALDDWTVYYPKHRIEKLSRDEYYSWDFWKHPIGNGPYRHVRTVPKTMLQLEANPDYYRGEPNIRNVVLKFGATQESGMSPATIELLSGNADAATSVKRTDVLKLATDPRFRVYDQVSSDLFTVLFLNHRHLLFRDPVVRRALTLAIDRYELAQILNFPPTTPVFDSPFSKNQLRRRDLPPPIPHDRELANSLLDGTGWHKRNRQGTRERNGKEFSFKLIRGTKGGAGQHEAAVYIQAQLERVGVRMNIEPMEGPTVWQRAATGDYEAAISIMLPGWDPGGGARRFLESAGYKSSRFVVLADRLQAALDPERQDGLYGEMTSLFQEDVPAIFLYPHIYTTIASRRIIGLDRSPNPGDLTWCMDDLSLAAKV
ncbi:MAG: hypothetical protein J0H49_13490 [Acidobacteria bacterium]|nr:hypothetical protein [Acidobacteriota bacterium]